jgi:LPXTG-motif cell wall-anchored protein
LLAVAGIGAAIMAPTAALAQTEIININVAEGGIVAPPDSVHSVATYNPPADLIGATCTGFAEAENQGSVHPGTDIIISIGGDTVEMTNVEDVGGKVTNLTGTFVMADPVEVSVRIGDDGVTSGGLVVTFECTPAQPAEPTTTSTIAAPPTTLETSTTAAGGQAPATTAAAAVAPVLPGTGSPSSTPVLVGLGLLALAAGGVLVMRRPHGV